MLQDSTRSQHGGEFELPVPRISVAAEHESILFSDYLRIQNHNATGIIHPVIHPHPRLRRKNMLRLDLPRSAAGREVSRAGPSFDEDKSPTGDRFDHIEIVPPPVNDVPIGLIRCADLFWLAADGH